MLRQNKLVKELCTDSITVFVVMIAFSLLLISLVLVFYNGVLVPFIFLGFVFSFSKIHKLMRTLYEPLKNTAS